jgi:glucose/arabinose dehydrogenase
LFITILAFLVSAARAATLPAGFAETSIGGLASPTAMALAPDGRIFVCQQTGALRVIKNGALLATPFLTVSVSSVGERGLLGVAFDPNFAANNFVYIYYTTSTAPIHNRISRFTTNGDVAVAGSETVLLDLNNLSATNHNGGAMHFGPDGKLYVAVGENAVASNSQTLNNLLGKMLRINPDGTIPTDNPFFNQAAGNNRAIWTLGLRNPFTFNFQPGTGRMFINDVGQVTWEEINDGIAGSNYGWPTCEGNCNPPNPNFRNPIFQYANDASTCAITGGAFYNPTTPQFPVEYIGRYFYADFCGSYIRFIDPANPAAATGFATGIPSPVDIQVANDGSLYYLARGSGAVFRVQYTANQPPAIASHPGNQTVSVGQSATFTVSATGTGPFTYQWQRNNTDIPGATNQSYNTGAVTLADNGAQFRCRVSNQFGNVSSNNATLTVQPNQLPTAVITAPLAGTTYAGGEMFNYSGTGTDPEDGALPASAFTWQVDFHHDDHVHPFIPPTSGVTSGSFTIPTEGETDANVFYRLYLTVRDSQNATHQVFRDLQPRTSQITINTNPAGLQITLDGQPRTAPFTITGVAGIIRQIGATTPQTLGGTTYNFSSWSDGGALTHNISTPERNATYTATFAPVVGVEFTTPTLQVNEAGGAAALTVMRNVTSSPLTVDYKTNDNFNFADCSSNNAQAQQRCDYTAAAGTLNFAAGEASKTVSVPLVDDFYVEGNETFSLSLSNPSGGAVLGANATVTVTIADNDTTPALERTFIAQLNAAQEVPSNNSTATGNGAVTLNAAETQITVNMTFSGLSSNQTAAHIHAAAHVGVNAPVLFNLGVGQISNATFNVTPAQVAQLKAGLMYFNVHTQNFTGGEIRGQILANPLESARFFVRQQYLDFLSREPDAGGFDFWTNQIVNVCGADLACINRRRVEVSAAFFVEQEFQETGAFVFRVYKAAFGEQPLYRPNYADFVPDRARVVGGADLNAGKLDFANSFAQRAAFTTRYPASMTAAEFVDAILLTVQQGAGVTFTLAERAAFINDVTNGGRGLMLRNLGDDAAFRAAMFNRGFVLVQYFGYLKRDPDQPGYDFWLNILNQQPANARGMVCAFVTAAEYQQRFSAVSPRSNADCNGL